MRVRTLGVCVAFAWLFVIGTRDAFPDLVAYDGFGYTEGVLGGNGAATDGWAGPWGTFDTQGNPGAGNYPRVVAPGLTFSDSTGITLLTTGNRVQPNFEKFGNAIRSVDLSPGSNADLAGLIDPGTGKLGRDGTSIWMSFLAVGPGGGSSTLWGGISLYNGANAQAGEELFFGKPADLDFFWGLIDVGGPRLVSDVPTTQKAFFVARIDFLPGADQVMLWLNPGLQAEPEQADADIVLTVSDFRFDRLRLAGADVFAVDEVRLGTSYSDVAPVPEPSAVVLLGAQLFALVTRARLLRHRRLGKSAS